MATPSLSASALIEALDEPVLIVGGGRTLAANKAALDLLGQTILDRDVRLAIRHPQALGAILAGRTADLAVVGLGSAQRPWHLSVRPIAKGHCVVRLTDRSTAIAAERMRVDFVANASHELRTPLATISGFAETLAEDEPIDDGDRRRFGSTIQTEAARMLRIIKDLMSLSRIEADRFVAPRDPVDLGAIARTAAEQAGPLAARKGCSIDLAAEAGLVVIGDHGQLLQVAENLISNAVRYGCNAASSAIRVEAKSEGGRAILRVIDQGDGITAIHLPRLTERFYRIDPARSRDSDGTGLGLAIVKHIVERHRGSLDIRSKPNAGTIVEMKLPLTA